MAEREVVVVLPERITVRTCIGCGAMGGELLCAAGCSEHRLDLVPSGALDSLAELALASTERLAALEPLARRLAAGPPLRSVESAYLDLRHDARVALGHERLPDDETPATVTGWWCAECGNLDLPQPCLGVCVWRPIDWLSLGLYQRERAGVDAEIHTAAAFEKLLGLVSAVTPSSDGWAASWRALGARAAAILRDCERPKAADPGRLVTVSGT